MLLKYNAHKFLEIFWQDKPYQHSSFPWEIFEERNRLENLDVDGGYTKMDFKQIPSGIVDYTCVTQNSDREHGEETWPSINAEFLNQLRNY